MKAKLPLIFFLITLPSWAQTNSVHDWTLESGAVVSGDYVSSGTQMVVIKSHGTNCLLKKSELSTNDWFYLRQCQTNQIQRLLDALAKQTDLLLWQNRKTELSEIEMEDSSTNVPYDDKFLCHTWALTLKGIEVDLSIGTTTVSERNILPKTVMDFELGKESLVSKCFDKFLDWEVIAATNHAENFKKEIARDPQNVLLFTDDLSTCPRIYEFSWEDGKAWFYIKDYIYHYSPNSIRFDKDDILHFQALLKYLPDMKVKLASAILNKEAQKNLFK
jgi:hypothetical protein